MLDRDSVIKTLQIRINEARNNGSKVTTIFISTLSACLTLLKEQKAVVRCKDCKHKEESVSPSWEAWCNRLHCGCDLDWFCADGECKEGR